MNLNPGSCSGVFCSTVAICLSKDISWGDVRSGFIFDSMTKTFKPEKEKRKEEKGLPAFSGAKGDQGYVKPRRTTDKHK